MSHPPSPQTLAASESPGVARRRVIVVAVCWALVLLDGIDTFIYGSALPEMINSGHGLSTSAGMFGVFRLLCGFGLGALLPIAIAYGMEFSAGRRKALVTGIIMTAHQTGGAIAPLIALALVDSAGWRWVFIISAVPAVALLPVAIKLLPESPPSWRLAADETPPRPSRPTTVSTLPSARPTARTGGRA